MTDKGLVRAANDVRKNAHAPYSGLRVGAAVLDGGGNVYTGPNVENASFGLTLCAERTALFSAVAAGALDRGIKKIAVVSVHGYPPCGACRQVMQELAPEAEILIATTGGNIRRITTEALLPDAFESFEPD